MSTSLENIVKSSEMIFLAADNGAFIIDDRENKFLIVKEEDTLSSIEKSDR